MILTYLLLQKTDLTKYSLPDTLVNLSSQAENVVQTVPVPLTSLGFIPEDDSAEEMYLVKWPPVQTMNCNGDAMPRYCDTVMFTSLHDCTNIARSFLVN